MHLDEFEAAILPWIAFSTIDLDRSASLSKDELKVLLWISDGIDTKEPSKQAIDKAISEMDVDKNGTIDRLEWVMYCSGYDAQTGAMKFSRSVRDLWRAIDLDGSHTVAIDEIRKEFIKELDAFMARHEADGARPFKPASREILNKLVHEAAADLRDEMDMNSDHIIEWNEFKKHQRGVAEKIDGVKKYASQIYAQDGAAEQAVRAVGAGGPRVAPRRAQVVGPWRVLLDDREARTRRRGGPPGTEETPGGCQRPAAAARAGRLALRPCESQELRNLEA